jgi:hypothetical protein
MWTGAALVKAHPATRQLAPPDGESRKRLQAALADRSRSVTLSAAVCMLGPSYFFEVSFEPAGHTGRPFRVLLTHPCTLAWYQQMDDLDEEGHWLELTENLVNGKRIVPFGEIRVTFPAALLPPGELRMKVEYKHLPRATDPQLHHLCRFACLRSLTLATSAPAGDATGPTVPWPTGRAGR